MTRYATKGPVVAEFARRAIRHIDGPNEGRRFELEPWQQEFLDEAFLIDADTGLRVYNEVVLGTPKKNGKTTFAAVLALYGLVQDGANGNRDPRPRVFAAASSKDQAKELTDAARDMASNSSVLNNKLVVVRAHDIILKPKRAKKGKVQRRGVLKPVAAEDGTAHGKNPSFAVIDELHSHPNGKLYTVLKTSTIAREQPLVLTITHTGWDRYGILGQVYDGAIAHPQLEVYGGGRKRSEPVLMVVRDRENGFLFWWYGAGDRDDINLENPSVWARCNPASWIDVRTIMKFRNQPGMREEDILRFHANAWVVASNSFLPAGSWAACADPNIAIPSGGDVFLGVDGASKHDYGAIGLCHVSFDDDGRPMYDLYADVFRSEDSRSTILRRLEDRLRTHHRRYRCHEVHYDPMMFTRSADDLEGVDGMTMVEFPQSEGRMAVSTAKFREHVMGNLIRHDGDPVLSQHVGHAITVETRRGWRVEKSKTKNKIDGLVAVMMALDAATNAVRRGDIGPGADIQVIG